MYGPDAKHFKDVSAMKATCMYCNTTINGGAERRRCHLARVKGMGVNTCTKVPLLVQQEFSELQNKHASKKRKAAAPGAAASHSCKPCARVTPRYSPRP